MADFYEQTKLKKQQKHKAYRPRIEIPYDQSFLNPIGSEKNHS